MKDSFFLVAFLVLTAALAQARTAGPNQAAEWGLGSK